MNIFRVDARECRSAESPVCAPPLILEETGECARLPRQQLSHRQPSTRSLVSASVSMCRVSSVVAAVMSLLALLLAATAGAVAVAAADNSSCALLASNIINGPVLWRSVAVSGTTLNVSLVWGSEPAHAAAALLAALLSYVRLYHGVQLSSDPSPHDTAELATNVTFSMYGYYNEDVARRRKPQLLVVPSARTNLLGCAPLTRALRTLNTVADVILLLYYHLYTDSIIGVSTAWKPKAARRWNPYKGQAPGLAGPRLTEFGASPVPVRRRLFAWLTELARASLDCLKLHVRWPFYANATALAGCDFVDDPQDNVVAVYVLGGDECEEVLRRLRRRAKHSGARLDVMRRSRAGFERSLQPQHSDNRSFLFLDYDMWQGASGVSVVEPPPCVSVNFDCKQELDSAIAMRVADSNVLEAYVPQLVQFVYDFQPSPESLRQILEQQASGVDIEEAACEWILKNNSHVISDEDKREYDIIPYTVYAYVCSGDSDTNFFQNLTSVFQDELNNYMVPEGSNVTISLLSYDCADQNSMSRGLKNHIYSRGYFRLLGLVLLSVEGALKASPSASASHVPFMLADVAPEDDSASSTWHVGPRPRHLALALLHFMRESRWTRVAVLSEPTKLAQDYYAALKDGPDIVLGDIPIPLDSITEQQAQKVLQDLQHVNARVVFINAHAGAANTILAAAVAAHMGYTDGFVWIFRDWQQKDVVCRTEHFTVSSWMRGVEDIPPGEGKAALHDKLNEQRRPWPPRAVSFFDALLTLVIGFKDVFQRFPYMRQDLHSNRIIRSLKESIISKPVTGVSQQLRFKERSIEETFVFVDQWCGSNVTQRLATWRVNATSGAVCSKSGEYAALSPPGDLPRYDGASGCVVRSGDAFHPTCHDIECACALLLLVLAPVAALLARRALRRRLARLLKEQQIQAIARRQHVATVLAAYLVERAALELHEELGAGRFGSVRLARLHLPARAPRYIAAKALRENAAPAEESEFLREACTVASLEHAHIVRLVGVCIADGPPLVLMELAFFGDLLGYLRARRHLVASAGLEDLEAPAAHGEAEHVSAAALTRLAREAAEALQYLGVRGVVHRDVRAANCLVDVRRSLKLADFGMARDTVAGADGAPEYACRRRGLFPVLWMAPESLAHGVFSAASDVWALGVLVLELVTLGARPYGAMSPLRVLEYVAAGGSPPLPLEATPQTRGLARLCWARVTERRPSAAEVAAYLAAWPLALRPALLSERNEPADADSGFGESPSTELLPPDSPLHSLDQLDNLAATQ